jgi:hypothetical protein
VERDIHFARDILHHNAQRIALDLVGDIFEREIAIAVGKGDLEIRFKIESAAPACELVRCHSDRGVEGGGSAWRMGGRKCIAGRKALAPIERLDLLLFVDAQHISDVGRVHAEDARRRVIRNARAVLLAGRGPAEHP